MTIIQINRPLHSALLSAGCDDVLAMKAATVPTDSTKNTHEDLYRALCSMGVDKKLAMEAAVNPAKESVERKQRAKRRDLLGSLLFATLMFGLAVFIIQM